MCITYCMFTLQSCSNHDEPTVTDSYESIKEEIVGTWVGEYSLPSYNYSMKSELTFGSDGKIILKLTSQSFSNQLLVGSQYTEFDPFKYEIKDNILECEHFGEYEILIAGNKLTLIPLDENQHGLWGEITYSSNDVTYEYFPNTLTYRRN